jgi:hypothetical protein
MENEDDIYNGLDNLYGQRAIFTPIGDRLAEIGHYGTSGNAGRQGPIGNVEPNFNGHPDDKDIVIPPTFKDVVMKMCPEIVDIVSKGYREHMVYNPMNFEPVYT